MPDKCLIMSAVYVRFLAVGEFGNTFVTLVCNMDMVFQDGREGLGIKIIK